MSASNHTSEKGSDTASSFRVDELKSDAEEPKTVETGEVGEAQRGPEMTEWAERYGRGERCTLRGSV